jgi:hypothetical protein
MKRSNSSACLLIFLLQWLCSFLPGVVHAQPFVSVDHHLPNLAFGSLSMGDYDNDGDLDAALVGVSSGSVKIGSVYLNDGSGSFQTGPSIPAVSPGQVCWADYDRDGDLDLLVSGMGDNAGTQVEVTRLLRNDNGVLTDSGIALPALSANALAFADFDNDGDLDLLMGGPSNGVSVTYLLWNQGNQFVQSGLTLPGILRGATIAPADCDNDGDMDLLLAPVQFNDPGLAEFGTLVLLNKGDGTFENRRVTIDAKAGITAAWHDFDLNGRLDLTAAGNSKWTVALYDSLFSTWRGSQFASIDEAQVAAGDYDRDGRPDIVVMGKSVGLNVPATILGRNVGIRVDGLDLNYPNVGLVGAWLGTLAFADVDGDADLDIAQIGVDSSGQRITKIYRNNLAGSFSLPAVPDQLSHVVAGSSATLSWQGTGGATTFNVLIGTTPGGVNIVTPMANVTTGRRRLAALGNAAQARSFLIQGLSPGRYYWSVQSIDAAFNGSTFAPEREFTIGDNPQDIRLSIRLDVTQNLLFLTLTGTAGRRAVPQRSIDLQDWQDVGSPVNTDQELSFPRPAESRVFFRARVAP